MTELSDVAVAEVRIAQNPRLGGVNVVSESP